MNSLKIFRGFNLFFTFILKTIMNKNNNYNNNNKSLVTIASYANAQKNKFLIYQDNRNKSGIYCWNNLITGYSYVGSGLNLSKRLGNYFSLRHLKREVSRNKSRISNAILKYGYENFSVDILEYCEADILIEREQYYLDHLKPEYNICKIAGSRLGTKHSLETLLKYKDRKLSPEAIINLKKAKAGIAPPPSPLRRINHLLATGHKTSVLNKINNSIKIYDSIRAAGRDIGVSHNLLLNYINTGKWLKGIYLISRKDK